MPFSGQVMLASITGTGSSYARLDLPTNPADIYVEFDVMFPQASLDAWQPDTFSPYFLSFVADPGGFPAGIGFLDYSGTWKWAVDDATPVSTVVGDTVYRVGFHYDELAGEVTFRLAGSDLATATDAGSTIGEFQLGLIDAIQTSTAYFDNVTASAIAWGGTDLLDNDFETAISPDFTDTSGSVSRVADPGAVVDVGLVGRVLIAFDDPPLTWEPTWTRIDDTDNLVAGFDIHRGRQTETEQTDTSTATVYLNDTDGLFDPNNASSPYFGLIDGKGIVLQLWNPVVEEWVPQWRGFIDDYGFDFNAATNAAGEPLVANIAIQCRDLFDYLAGVEMIPGLFGQTAPADSVGTVFYEDGDVQTRIENLLVNAFAGDAATAADFSVVFTGNVDVQQTKYDPGDSILVALRDACDAEFPSIANMYTDKTGRFTFHGRDARFHPDTVSFGADWTFTRWKAGDGTAIGLDADRAQIRPPLTWSRPRSRIVNAAMCYPRGIDESAIPGQIVVDTTSRDAYGYRSWSATDLIIGAGTTTGNTADEECALFAEWRVANFKDPRTLIEALTFKSIHPADARAEPTWALLCGQEISDIVDLEHGYPGGTGISENFYIEGSEMQVRPLTPAFDFVTLTLNVSPESYYTDDVFAVS